MKKILCCALCVGLLLGAMPAMAQEYTVEKNDLSINTALSSDVQNILMLLQDSENTSASTTILVASINKRDGGAVMVTLVPNVVVDMPLAGEQLLCDAYALGGQNLAMKTINALYGLNIKQYVVIDVKNFGVIIERVEGMNIELTQEEATALGLSAGYNTLDTAQTLAYMRLPSEDLSISRPYKSVMQLLYQGTRDKNPMTLMDIGGKVLDAVDTNLGMMDMISLATSVMGGSQREELLVPGTQSLDATLFNGRAAYTIDLDAAKQLLMDTLYK